MPDHYKLMLAGTSTAAGNLNVTSPFSDELLATVEQCGGEHIEAALAAAAAAFADRSAWLSVGERQKILLAVADAMAADVEGLARLAASEGGKPLIDSRVEVNRAIEGVRMCAEHIGQHAGEVIPVKEALPNTRRMAFTQREPIGVVVAVSAFNHPLNLIVHQVGAAVAAGYPVIVKPADDTPLSCLKFVSLLRDAGLPEDWCQVAVPESIDLATKLVADKRVAFFSFIGSARVGWMLRSRLSPGTRCALEHGGVAPVIVHRSASLEKVIPSVLKGGFYHTGQGCVSVQRVFVESQQAGALCDALVEGAAKLVVGDPLNDATEVGPLIRPAEVERVHQWVQDAVAAGAQLLCGGKKMEGHCYEPTVLLNPPRDAAVSTNEVFGPVVCVYSYDDVDAAIAQANELDVAFQAAVFAQDIDAAMRIYDGLAASRGGFSNTVGS